MTTARCVNTGSYPFVRLRGTLSNVLKIRWEGAQNSGNPADARLDTEGIRVSNDKKTVFISDEYGPYIYQFDRSTGERIRSFKLPDNFYVTVLKPVGSDEISMNIGRTANKGLEGLAISPDGRTLVAIIQAALIQDPSKRSRRQIVAN